MTTIALSQTAATATEDLADGNDLIFFREFSNILISAVGIIPVVSCPPTITGGDELGTRAVCQ